PTFSLHQLELINIVLLGVPIFAVIGTALGVFACDPLAQQVQRRGRPSLLSILTLFGSPSVGGIYASSTFQPARATPAPAPSGHGPVAEGACPPPLLAGSRCFAARARVRGRWSDRRAAVLCAASPYRPGVELRRTQAHGPCDHHSLCGGGCHDLCVRAFCLLAAPARNPPPPFS